MMRSTRCQNSCRGRRLIAPADRQVVAPAEASRDSHRAATAITPPGVFGERGEGVEGGRLLWYFWTSSGAAALVGRRR